ncbi:hypothetical protein ACTFQF_00920 [Aliivibrio fischeri]|uniref:hypothetical protein n=1 Tax=Aliivibrio fischeri TaxID=668 RepID=UPI003F7598BB
MKKRRFTQEDRTLIELQIEKGVARKEAAKAIYEKVYGLKPRDFALIDSLCSSNGEDYRDQAFETIFKRNREKLKRLIIARAARAELKKLPKEEKSTFSWSASIHKRR